MPKNYTITILKLDLKISKWKIINSKRETAHQDIPLPLLVQDHKIITNQQKIANLFNNYLLLGADIINADRNKDENFSMINSVVSREGGQCASVLPEPTTCIYSVAPASGQGCHLRR
jgi:hypothetical protein